MKKQMKKKQGEKVRNKKNQKLGKRKQKRVIAEALGVVDSIDAKHKYQRIDAMNDETFVLLKLDYEAHIKGLYVKV